jgi:hypothetical protein
VRLELAANFDHVTAADLGACGEPFTPDIVCALTLGFEFHGLTGIGIAGVERPPNPWDDIKGLEFGGRIEFRWDRFSVAIADFYGYNDFPHPDPIYFYDRNVDTVSGRPLVAEGLRGARGPPSGAAPRSSATRTGTTRRPRPTASSSNRAIPTRSSVPGPSRTGTRSRR